MTNTLETECPECGTELELILPQWNSKTICPNCKTAFFIEYDEVIGTDDSYDTYYITLLNERNNCESLDIAKATIAQA